MGYMEEVTIPTTLHLRLFHTLLSNRPVLATHKELQPTFDSLKSAPVWHTFLNHLPHFTLDIFSVTHLNASRVAKPFCCHTWAPGICLTVINCRQILKEKGKSGSRAYPKICYATLKSKSAFVINYQSCTSCNPRSAELATTDAKSALDNSTSINLTLHKL